MILTFLTDPWLRLGGVVCVMGALLVGVRLYQQKAKPDPEVARKVFHLCSGLMALSLPWVFHELWSVLFLGAVFATAFMGFRMIPALRTGPGQVLYGVERESFGEFFFLVSVCLVFALANENRVLYVVSLLILILSDSAAALIGLRYGKVFYWSTTGEKSAEGSLAFFLTAFLCVHIPLLVWTDIGRVESLVTAVLIGLLVMLSEAISWRGLDNLFIPIFSYILLRFFLDKGVPELLLDLAVLVGLVILVYLWRRRTTLSDDALFGVPLFSYLVWSLSGWRWLIPPLILFVTYTAISTKTELDPIRIFNLRVLLAVASAALFWLFLYGVMQLPEFFYPYATALAANLSIIAIVRRKYVAPEMSLKTLFLRDGWKGVLILLPSFLVIDGLTPLLLVHLLVGVVTIFVASLFFSAFQPHLETYPADMSRWIRQSIAVLVTSVFSLVPHAHKLLGVI